MRTIRGRLCTSICGVNTFFPQLREQAPPLVARHAVMRSDGGLAQNQMQN